MKLLFEGHWYKKGTLEKVIPEEYIVKLTSNEYELTNLVGYCYFSSNKLLSDDYVIILPKIFVINGKAFGVYKCDDIILNANSKISQKYISLVNSLSCLIYKSLLLFSSKNLSHKESFIQISIPQIESHMNGTMSCSLLDIYFSFCSFAKKNKNLFLIKTIDSNGNSKTNWQKTVEKIDPFWIDDFPYYFDFKSKVSNYSQEDTLICLFYSVLNYFNVFYRLPIPQYSYKKIIQGTSFDLLLKGKGCSLLNKIKHNYFSDVYKKLLGLLFLFFDYMEQRSKLTLISNEIVLTEYFSTVFENMIDDLICGTEQDLQINKFYKDQKDGRIVDHIYLDTDLFNDKKIHYIGDSKYYKDSSEIHGPALYKQFTYAKNVIQLGVQEQQSNIKIKKDIIYRDELTEGYNITPNFFISAVYNPEDDNYCKGNLKSDGSPIIQSQFKDRLFDRDTLAIMHYDLDFMFIISSYTSNDEQSKAEFREDARSLIRINFINYLNRNYYFFELSPAHNCSLEEFISTNFKLINGKCYKLKKQINKIILALSRNVNSEKDIECFFKMLLKWDGNRTPYQIAK